MAVEGVRKVNVGPEWTPSESTETDKITIQFEGEKEPEQYFSGYTYPDQKIYVGDFEYSSPSSFGSSGPITGELEFRTESGLLVLKSDETDADLKNVFEAVRSAINNGADVERSFVPERTKVWDFLSYCVSPDRIDVVTPFGGVERAVPESEARTSSTVTIEEAQNKYPVDYARVQFSRDDSTFEVEYHTDKLVVNSEDSADREYIVQVFESTMMPK